MNQDPRMVDQQHLGLLAIFHFVVAGLLFAFIGFLVMHYLIMSTVFNSPQMWKNAPNPPPPEIYEIFGYFKYVYLVLGVCLVAGSVANLFSGLFLRARKHRTFSLIVAGINCLQIPFGTVLGVFTIVVLLRESVRQLYERG